MTATAKMLDRSTCEVTSENRTVILSAEELHAIRICDLHTRLRDSITCVVEQMVDDEDIDLNDYPYTKEELIDEVYIDLEDAVDSDQTPFPSDEYISEQVTDLIDFYVTNRD